jgi:hypothetical protein
MTFENTDATNQDHWYFFVNGYMLPYSEEATFANDWLDSGITLIIDGKEIVFPLQHLLVEELENFKQWLINIQLGTPSYKTFDFIDADLVFEFVEANPFSILRLTRGYDWEKQFVININIKTLPSHIGMLALLLDKYPSRWQ